MVTIIIGNSISNPVGPIINWTGTRESHFTFCPWHLRHEKS